MLVCVDGEVTGLKGNVKPNALRTASTGTSRVGLSTRIRRLRRTARNRVNLAERANVPDIDGSNGHAVALNSIQARLLDAPHYGRSGPGKIGGQIGSQIRRPKRENGGKISALPH